MSNNIRSLKRAKEKQQAKEGVIKVTLAQIIRSLGPQPEIPGAIDFLMSQALPIRTSFQLNKIAKAAIIEFQEYQAAKKTLCERLANKDKDGKAIILEDGKPSTKGEYDIPADKLVELEKEHADLIAMEVEIPGQQIKVGDLGDARIAPAHLMALEWLVID